MLINLNISPNLEKKNEFTLGKYLYSPMYASCNVRKGANMDCGDRRQSYTLPTQPVKSQYVRLTAVIKFQGKNHNKNLILVAESSPISAKGWQIQRFAFLNIKHVSQVIFYEGGYSFDTPQNVFSLIRWPLLSNLNC